MKFTVQDPTCESLLQEFFSSPFMYANQDYLNATISYRANLSDLFIVFSIDSLPQLQVNIVVESILYLASTSSLQSGNICKSLYSVLHFHHRSTLLHMYFCLFFQSNHARSLDTQRAPGVSSTEHEHGNLMVYSVNKNSVSYTHAQCSHYFNHDSFL